MRHNKITLNDEVVIDLTQDTVTEEDVVEGKTFHKADGTTSVGTLIPEDLDAKLTEQEDLIAELKDALTSGGSGGGNWEEWIGDGKTHLFSEIAAEGRMDVTLNFTQTVSNGVSIDWGDGSAPQTLSGSGKVSTTHTYASIGKYVITLDIAEGCTIELGHSSYGTCVMGRASYGPHTSILKKAEISNGVTKLSHYTFNYCCSLTSVVIANSVTSIDSGAFDQCHALVHVVIPNSVTSIGSNAFSYCRSLASIVIPNSVTSIGSGAFNICSSLASVVITNSETSIGSSAFSNCTNTKVYDFTKCTSVPTLPNTNVFMSIPSDCEIRVPMALIDEWKAATN